MFATSVLWLIAFFSLNCVGKELTIKLTVQERAGVDREQWPVTQGIPFREGALDSTKNLRILDPNSNAVPAAFTTLTSWTPESNSVKWVLADFQATVAAHDSADYFLTTSSPSDPQAPTLEVTESEDEIRLDTGPIVVSVSRKWGSIIDRVWTRDAAGQLQKIIANHRNGGGPYVVDHRDRAYWSWLDYKTFRAEVEERNPMRCVIKQTGWFSDPATDRFCRFICRIHAYAGKPFLKLEHTFIYTGINTQQWIRGMGIVLKPSETSALKYAIGGSPGYVAHGPLDTGEDAQIIQFDDRRFQLRPARTSNGSKSDGLPGGQAEGWADLSSGRGGVTAAVRHFWQMFPKGFRLSEEGIDIQLWPEDCGRELDFERQLNLYPHVPVAPLLKSDGLPAVFAAIDQDPRHPVDLGYYSSDIGDLDGRTIREIYARYGESRRYLKGGFYYYCGNMPTGTARTHDILLHFHPGPGDAQTARDLNAAFQSRLLALPSAKYMCQTEVMGRLRPVDLQRYPKWETPVQSAYRTMKLVQNRCALYGMMHFGDSLNFHAHGGLAWAFNQLPDFERRMPEWMGWDGNVTVAANGLSTGLWLYFLRTGDPAVFDDAEHRTRCVMDVSVGHHQWEEGADWQVGRTMGCNQTAWWSWAQDDVIEAHTEHALTYYYLTGDRRALNVAREVVDRIVRFEKEHGSRGVPTRLPFVYFRGWGATLAGLLWFYEATHEEKYLEVSRRLMNQLLRSQRENGSFAGKPRHQEDGSVIWDATAVSYMGTGNFERIIGEYLRVTRDDNARQAMMRAADFVIESNQFNDYATFGLMAAAYYESGDKKYLKAFDAHYDQVAKSWNGWAAYREDPEGYMKNTAAIEHIMVNPQFVTAALFDAGLDENGEQIED